MAPKQKTASKAFRKVLDVFFGGSVEDAPAMHLADPKTNLSDEEVKRLRRLLSQHHQEVTGKVCDLEFFGDFILIDGGIEANRSHRTQSGFAGPFVRIIFFL